MRATSGRKTTKTLVLEQFKPATAARTITTDLAARPPPLEIGIHKVDVSSRRKRRRRLCRDKG
ncbi:hypothetical protein LTS17_011313 [Exophiala oligosperma]